MDTGVIASDGHKNIPLMNPAAESLLAVMKPGTWQQLWHKRPLFCRKVDEILGEGHAMVEYSLGNEMYAFNLHVTHLKIGDKMHVLITFQNIRNEIQQKETDAWIRLIRVLRECFYDHHTPISSLTDTILMVIDKHQNEKGHTGIDANTLEDVIDSVKTIRKRSNGLFDFVSEYRKLTRIPNPTLKNTTVKILLQDVIKLMKSELKNHDVEVQLESFYKNLTIRLDSHLIEQVLINLIRNSIEALENVADACIRISVHESQSRVSILLEDNGCGIETKYLDEVFVPFFSTKEDGSGIGLSLSRQIMNKHGGNISIRSKAGEGTVVSLHFNT